MVSKRTKFLAKTGLLGAMSAVLMFLAIQLPMLPGFLKLDLSEIPALLAAFALGPLAGIGVELIKNAVQVLFTQTGGVGELANFLIGCAMVVPAGYFYQKVKTHQGALIGLFVGGILMVIGGAVINYTILLPLYQKMMPLEKIIAWSATANGAIKDIKTLILYGITPFNVVKAVVVSIITLLIYKKVSRVLHH